MTRKDLKEFRRLRWNYIKKGTARAIRNRRYRELYMEYEEAVGRLDGAQRAIFVEYYHNVRSIVYISMQQHYSERSVKRIKRKAVARIEN